MTVLAIRLANITNGVSQLHGKVSRRMWKNLWPELPEAEMPITLITNGVHAPTWVSTDMMQLYDRYLGAALARPHPATTASGNVPSTIPDAELWRTHERRRERLVTFARTRLKNAVARSAAWDRRRSPGPRRCWIRTL